MAYKSKSKTRKGRKQRTHKVRRHRQRGAGWGFTGPSSIPGTPGTVSNPQVFTGIGDCRAVKPGYDIPYSQYANSFKGLPGMSGGKRSRKAMKGGRYGFYPEGDVNPSGQAWWAGSYAPIQRIACEGTTQNPLNPTHTGSTAPPGAASPNYYLNPGKGLMSGGAQQMAPATYGVGNVDSMYYYAPTAGYANTASTWKDSVGAPVQIQVPFAARSMNQACLTTGGSPPLTGALQKGGKRSRKQRGGNNITLKNNNLSKNGKGWLNAIQTTLFGNSKNKNENIKPLNNSDIPTSLPTSTTPNNPPVNTTTNVIPTSLPNRVNVTPSIRNNISSPLITPTTPSFGGKRKGRKGKKSRKAHRKH